MTHLRKIILEELQRRNYSQNTMRAYVRIIRELSAYFRQPPDRLGAEHMRIFQTSGSWMPAPSWNTVPRCGSSS